MEVDEKVLKIAGKANSKLAFQCNVDNEIVAFVAGSIEEREDLKVTKLPMLLKR